VRLNVIDLIEKMNRLDLTRIQGGNFMMKPTQDRATERKSIKPFVFEFYKTSKKFEDKTQYQSLTERINFEVIKKQKEKLMMENSPEKAFGREKGKDRKEVSNKYGMNYTFTQFQPKVMFRNKDGKNHFQLINKGGNEGNSTEEKVAPVINREKAKFIRV